MFYNKYMSIINEFSSEKELFEVYPKKFHWYLKDIFLDYWDDFLDFADKKIFLYVLLF